MDTKLTLKLNKTVVEEAKKYAGKQNTSLSKIIESYLKLLTEKGETHQEEIEISPFVKSLSTGQKVPADIDEKSGYKEFLEEKHQ